MPHDVLEPCGISFWTPKAQHHVIRNSALNNEQKEVLSLMTLHILANLQSHTLSHVIVVYVEYKLVF